ncbi:ribonuclease H-like domain-containing protein [Xylariaceae sp. FL1651]|nr:ribonuclease H-like domain-containing protein [Xylariaceae sp. FL1651]
MALPRRDSNDGPKPYAALVIDCEMVALEGQISDLVRLAVVDFATGDVVLNTLVQPTGHVIDWRARVSGVNPAILRAAKGDSNTTVLRGWPEARQKIFTLADSNTILVGHALPNDLKALRIAADRVVDTLVLTAKAVFGLSDVTFPRKWSLKTLCKELMGINIQNARLGHDCVEDALATRELILWCLSHPQELQAWGKTTRVVFEKEKLARQERQKAEAEARREKQKAEAAAAASAGMIQT